MTPKEITSVAIKAFVIYILLQAIFSIPVLASSLLNYGFSEYGEPSDIFLWLLGLVSFVVVIVLAVLMWKLANGVVEQAKTSDDATENQTITQDFLISLLGFYLVLEGLIQLGYSSFSSYTTLQQNIELTAQQIFYVVANFVQIVIGLTLIIKAKGWASFLNWLRGAGLKGKM